MNAASSALPQIHHSFIWNRNAPLRFKPVKQSLKGVSPDPIRRIGVSVSSFEYTRERKDWQRQGMSG